MLKAIDRYLQDQPDYGDAWQIDVIAVQRLSEDQPPAIEHFDNVVMNNGRE